MAGTGQRPMILRRLSFIRGAAFAPALNPCTPLSLGYFGAILAASSGTRKRATTDLPGGRTMLQIVNQCAVILEEPFLGLVTELDS